ncbi:hypothetical protein HMPREF0530_3029, partial [Lacticaseibacillus paracasei subsp. paracasei ATCC 25302 = DSM 5622 = JCM 8130]
LPFGNFFFDHRPNSSSMILQEFSPVLMFVEKDRLKNILFHTKILPKF